MPAVMAGEAFWSSSTQSDLPLGNRVAEEEGDEVWFDVTEHSLVARQVRTGRVSFEPPPPVIATAPSLKAFEKVLGFSHEFLRQLAGEAEFLQPLRKPLETLDQKMETDDDDDDDDLDSLGASAKKVTSEIDKYKAFLNGPDPRIQMAAAVAATKAQAIAASYSDSEDNNAPLEKFSKYKTRSSSAMFTDYRLQEGRAELKVYNNDTQRDISRDKNLNRPKKNIHQSKFPSQDRKPNTQHQDDYSSQGARPRTYNSNNRSNPQRSRNK